MLSYKSFKQSTFKILNLAIQVTLFSKKLFLFFALDLLENEVTKLNKT